MPSQVFQLSILIAARDAASGQINHMAGELRALGKEGRGALKSLEDLRSEMRRGAGMAGVGIAGLAALRGGVRVAGDFEAAMADLRMSIQEVGSDGRINLAKLGDEMNRFEQLGVKLGNALPGTTQDFIEMFSTLKQGGLDTKSILGGTGEAVANLAVVTGQVPRDLAEPFAQYAMQFKLTGDEAIKLSDVLAKLKFRTGLNPQELIEGSKFFQLRAGAPLGLTGLQGAEISGRVLAVLRKSGLEGGVGGRELATMFGKLTLKAKEQQKALSELRGQGINLDFFGKKGEFLGVENVFAQMEKLRKLTQEQRIDISKKLFGEEAVGPASVMIDAGVKGWRDINAEIDKGASLTDLAATKTQTFNAKLEATKGTIENLVATTFTPMLDTLKPVLDLTNSIAGSLQEWSKEHQTIAGIATHLVGLGSVTLVVVGGFKAMRTAWGLWRIASAISAGDRALPEYFRKTGDEAQKAGAKVGGYGRQLKGIPTALASTVTLVVATETLSYILRLKDEARQAWEDAKETNATAAKMLLELRQKAPQKFADVAPLQIQQNLANELKTDDSKIHTLLFGPSGAHSWVQGIFGDMFVNKEDRAARLRATVAERFPELRDPAAFGFFKQALEKQNLDPAKKQLLLTAAMEAFPQSVKQFELAMQQAAQGNTDALNKLMGSCEGTQKVMESLRTGADDAASSVNRMSDNIALLNSLLSIKAGGEPGSGTAPLQVPLKASGGFVERGGMAIVHAGETVVPARVTREYKGGATGNHFSGPITINFRPPAGSRAADDPQAFAEAVERHLTRRVRRQRERS